MLCKDCLDAVQIGYEEVVNVFSPELVFSEGAKEISGHKRIHFLIHKELKSLGRNYLWVLIHSKSKQNFDEFLSTKQVWILGGLEIGFPGCRMGGGLAEDKLNFF